MSQIAVWEFLPIKVSATIVKADHSLGFRSRSPQSDQLYMYIVYRTLMSALLFGYTL